MSNAAAANSVWMSKALIDTFVVTVSTPSTTFHPVPFGEPPLATIEILYTGFSLKSAKEPDDANTGLMLVKTVLEPTLFLILFEPTNVSNPVLAVFVPEYKSALAPDSMVTVPGEVNLIFPPVTSPARSALLG